MPEYLKATIQVRRRPVGVIEDERYTSLMALERGYFPVSHTGYRSLTGMRPEAVSLEMLEALAVQQDRERLAIVRDVSARLTVSALPLINYVNASHLAENAVDYGFFAEAKVRQVLWPAAHRLYGLIVRDKRFQPVPDERWEPVHCENALAKARESLELVERFCRGEFPVEPPLRFLTARTYSRLGPNGPEPMVELGGETTEFGFEIEHNPTSPAMRKARDEAISADANQLDLFGEKSATGIRPTAG